MLLPQHTTMNKLRTKYQTWIQRRRARFIKSWALRRAKGKKRFLAWGTGGMTLALIASEILGEQSWNKGFDGWPLKVFVYLAVSLIAAAIAWRESEKAYRRYLNAEPKTELDTPRSTPKHNKALQLTAR
jgi:hypothetical protein